MRKDLTLIGILFLLVFVFFFKAATLEGTFVTGDISGSDLNHQNYPLKFFLSESLKAGRLPLWCPYLHCGFPVFAEGQVGALYPANLLFFFLLRPEYAFNWATILNYFLAGLFMFIYIRTINLSHGAALLAAAAFAFSGFFVTHLKHLNLINAAVWLPLLLALIENYFSRNKLFYLVLAGMVLALQVFAGHPQLTFIAWFGLALYYGFRLLNIDKGRTLSAITAFLLAVLIGLSLSAVQWMPTLELVVNSFRGGGTGYKFATQFSYHPMNLFTFLLPNLFGNPANGTYLVDVNKMGIFWENCAYLGVIPLILAILAIVVTLNREQKNRYVMFFAGLLAFSLLLAMGRFTPFYYLFYAILPPLRYFRVPARFVFLALFSLAVLSAFGLDLAAQRVKSGKKRWATVAALVSLTVIDLFAFGMSYNPVYELKKWFAPPQTAAFLQRQTGIFRVCSLRPDLSWVMAYRAADGWRGDLTPYYNQRESLHPNTNLQYHLYEVGGSFGLWPERMAKIYSFPLLGNTLPAKGQQFFHRNFMKIVGMQNVKYIVSMVDLVGRRLTLKFKTSSPRGLPAFKVYENHLCLPRVFVVPGAKIIKSEHEALEEILSDGFDPKKYVILEKKVEWGSPGLTRYSASILKYSATEAVIQTESDGNAFLFFSDSYYPGWRAYVDGEQTEILRANYAFRSVKIPAGTHLVRFAYEPLALRLGAMISLFALAACAVILRFR